MADIDKSINFMGLAAVYVADKQNPFATKADGDEPINWVRIGDFLVDSVSFGRDDATQNDIMVEEKDDAIFTDFTNQPLKMAGNSPNLTEYGKELLGGYTRKVINGESILDAPKQAPNVEKMIKVVPKNGSYKHIIIYNGVINLASGDNLSKSETYNDKMTLTALAPTQDMVSYAGAGSYALVRDVSTDANIIQFNTVKQVGAEVITDGATNTIAITVESGTVITAIKPFIITSDAATVSPASGVAQDFTSAVTYTVTAQDGSTTKEYEVSITVAS